MRRLVYILLLMVVAGTVGCHRTPSDVERQLIVIDSLIGSTESSVSYGRGCSPADSALKLLAALSPSPDSQPAGSSEPSGSSGSSGTSGNSVDSSPSKLEGARGSVSATDEASTGSVSASKGTSPGDITKGKVVSPVPMTEAERAYHALLTAQAMWKAYIPATTDSVIRCAWQYYEHNGAYDRRIRAMLYMGTTAEELGHPEEAMRWYKRTELEAAPDDHYHRGYTLMSMAFLYQYQYIASEKSISLYRQALENFKDIEDLHYQIVCMTQLGQIYRLENVDSAIYFANSAIKLSKIISDTLEYYRNIESLAGSYYKIKDWNKTLRYSLISINNSSRKDVLYSYCFASQSYIKLGKNDSAVYLMNQTPKPKTVQDSVLYYLTYAMIDSCYGNYSESTSKKRIADNIAEAYFLDKSEKDYATAENFSVVEAQEHKNKVISHKVYFYVAIIVSLIVVILLVIYKYIVSFRKAKQWKGELFIAQEQLENLQKQLEEKKTELYGNKSDERIKVQTYCVNELFTSVIYSGKRGASIIKELFNSDFYSIKLSPDFWHYVDEYLSISYPLAIANIQKNGIKLTDKEIKIIALDCLHVPNAVIGLVLGYGERSLASTRSKLISKIGNGETDIEKIMKFYSNLYK